jgi:hypothetical protein
LSPRIAVHLITQVQERTMTSHKVRETIDAERLADGELEKISGGRVISKGVLNSSAISLPKPAYPAIA